MRDALEQAGYRVIDGAELKSWMDGHIADGELSVVVMCRDIVPDTVAETQDTNCTIRRYLDAGGKVVWYSDWPFYYRGTTGTTIFRGGVWSFTAEPIAYPIETITATCNAASNIGSGPERTIDEVQDAESWEGVIWSFSTQAYLTVEDFESYDDDDNRIYLAWIDGYEINENGSTVGNLDAPFAEMTIVHGGRQSMPLFYDNTGTTISEAEYTFGTQDWTSNGIESLSLYFYGAAGNGGQLYAKINNTKIVYDGPAVNITRPAWQLWSIDLSTAGNVSNVSALTIGIEGAGAQGVVYIDDIGLYPEVFQYLSPDITGVGDTVQGVPNDGVTTGGDDNGWPAGETPELAIDNDTSTKFLHFKGNAEPTGLQITPLTGPTIVTGVAFTTANDAAERDPASFELYGSNAGIDGPYTLIASGDIVDFTQATAWPRFTKNETVIAFENTVAYAHYQVLFPAVRDPDNANSMQIAEVELLP